MVMHALTVVINASTLCTNSVSDCPLTAVLQGNCNFLACSLANIGISNHTRTHAPVSYTHLTLPTNREV